MFDWVLNRPMIIDAYADVFWCSKKKYKLIQMKNLTVFLIN